MYPNGYVPVKVRRPRRPACALIRSPDMSRPLMYVKPGCPWCERQRERFRAAGVEWDELDATADAVARAELIRLTSGTRIVPTVAFPDGSVQLGVDGGG